MPGITPSRSPWLVPVPRRPDLGEITDSDAAGRASLIEEIAAAADTLRDAMGAARIDAGALGKMVAQLHVRVAARSAADPAWPGPVWDSGTALPCGAGAALVLAEPIATALHFR